MPAGPDSPSGAVEFAFLERYYTDAARGAPAPLSEYLRAFPGYESRVAAEHTRLEQLHQDDSDLPDPHHLGGYIPRRELGRGGQAVVYEAWDPRLKRRVALKVLRVAPALGRRALARFSREAEVASRIEQRGLCAIYGAGAERGLAWIAMRCVEGETLAARIEGRRRNPAGVPEIDADLHSIERVLDILHRVHEVGLVHRDLKPGNIMVEADGPVILDFGLAHDQESEDGQLHTLSHERLGTPAYMAPEQVQGAPADRRSDVYACGLVLYELLTLHHPFAAPTRELMARRVLEEAPDDPRRHRARLPRDLVTVLHTALSRDVDRRYQSAAAFAEDLRRLRQGRPILARRPGPGVRCWMWARRNRALAVSLCLLFAVLAAGLGLTSVLLWQLRGEQASTEASLRRARALALASAAQGQAEEAPLTGLLLALRAERTAQLPETLAALSQCWDRVRVRRQERFARGSLRCAATVPGGVVVGCADGTLRFWRGERAETCRTDAGPLRATSPSPDGRRVFGTTVDGVVQAWDVESRRALATCDAGASVISMSVDAGSGTLAFGDVAGNVWTWRPEQVDAGASATRMLEAPGGVIRVLYSPAGSHLLVLTVKGTAQVLDRAGAVRAQWRTDGRWAACFLDDDTVATSYVTLDDTRRQPVPGVVVTDLRDGSTIRFPDLYRLRAMAALPDRRLVIAGGHGQVDVLALDPVGRTGLAGHNHRIQTMAVDPDGRILTASHDQTLRLTDPRTGSSRVFHGHQGGCIDARFLADGTLFSVGLDGMAAWWSPRGPGDLATPPRFPFVGETRTAPDGRMLALLRDGVLWFDPADPASARRLPCPAAPLDVQVSPGGRDMLVAMAEGRTELWSLAASPRRLAGAPLYGVQGRSVLIGDTGRVFTAVIRQRYIWDAGGTAVVRVEDSADTVVALAAEPRRGHVACGDASGRVEVFDATGASVLELPGLPGSIDLLAFHPGGTLFVCCPAQAPAEVFGLDGRSRFRCADRASRTVVACFSADGRWLLTMTEDGHGEVRSVADGRLVTELPGLGGSPSAGVFSHDGRHVAVASLNGRVRLHAVDGTERLDLPRLREPATRLEFDAGDGLLLVSGMGDRVCRWPVRRAELVAAARDLAFRDFTPEERERFAALLEGDDGR